MPEFPELPAIADQPLSLILLARNVEAHVQNVLEKWVDFLQSRNTEYEILFVDDASTDQTITLVEGLAESNPSLKLLAQEKLCGEGVALGTGLRAAVLPLVAYAPCHPDYAPEHLQRLFGDIDRVHLVSGYRAGVRMPLVLRLSGLGVRGLIRLLFSLRLTRLPGWLGWRGHWRRWCARVFFGVRLNDVNCPLRLLRREILWRTPIQSKTSFAHIELLAKANFTTCLLGEEVPLDLMPFREPLVPETCGQIMRDATQVFSHPDFGPVLAPVVEQAAVEATETASE